MCLKMGARKTRVGTPYDDVGRIGIFSSAVMIGDGIRHLTRVGEEFPCPWVRPP